MASPAPSVLAAAIWTQVSVVFAFVVMHFWARFERRGVSLDDWLMLASWLCFLASAVMIQLGSQSGIVRSVHDMDSETERYKIQMIIIFSALGIATTCLGKVAIGVTMVRIIGSTSPWKRWAILVLLGFMTLFSLTDIMLYLFRCGDPRAQWDHRLNRTATCLPIAKTGLFNAITNGILVFADYFLSVLPMAVIWGLQMPLARRLAINGLIGLTIITGVAGTVKLVHVSRLDEDNINGGLYDSLIWYGIETMFIIVFGSVPTLRPLWERFFHLLGSSAKMQKDAGGRDAPHQMPPYCRQPSTSGAEYPRQGF